MTELLKRGRKKRKTTAAAMDCCVAWAANCHQSVQKKNVGPKGAATVIGPGRGVNSLSINTQTSLSPATSSSSDLETFLHQLRDLSILYVLGLSWGLRLVGHPQNTSPRRLPGGIRTSREIDNDLIVGAVMNILACNVGAVTLLTSRCQCRILRRVEAAHRLRKRGDSPAVERHMESSEFEDVLDEWFIESLTAYKDLHVYQLEHPTHVIEWTSGKTVCVAGDASCKNELLELRLPLKLFAEENKGLCAERDFKVVHGGFSEGPVGCLRYVPGTRLIVTNDGRGTDLQVWDLGGDDSDVIRRAGSVKGRESAPQRGSRIAASASSSPQVLHGAESSSVQLTQLTSGQSLYKLDTDSADPLNSLQFTDGAVFLAGCSNGKVYIADTRMSAAPQISPPPASSGQSVIWWTDTSADPQQPSCRVVRLSSSGHAVVSDLRKLGEAVCQAQLDIHSRPDNVTVSWAPRRNFISVSGFSGVVEIYDTRDWRMELRRAQPLFQHRGHAVSCQQTDGCDPIRVTAHVWHPERPQTLLSTASDGSVHVWDWVEPDSNRLESKPEPRMVQDQK